MAWGSKEQGNLGNRDNSKILHEEGKHFICELISHEADLFFLKIFSQTMVPRHYPLTSAPVNANLSMGMSAMIRAHFLNLIARFE